VETQLPQGEGRSSPPPLFGACLLWPNGRPSQLLNTCLKNIMAPLLHRAAINRPCCPCQNPSAAIAVAGCCVVDSWCEARFRGSPPTAPTSRDVPCFRVIGHSPHPSRRPSDWTPTSPGRAVRVTTLHAHTVGRVLGPSCPRVGSTSDLAHTVGRALGQSCPRVGSTRRMGWAGLGWIVGLSWQIAKIKLFIC